VSSTPPDAPLASDDAVRVVVLRSANPDFFIAHADVTLIQRLPTTPPPPPTELGLFHAMVDRFRTMPKATIGVVEGIARGGGSELLLSLDMRFAALGRARLAQPEVALGIIPGGSGTQRLPRLVGRARALEIILGCDDIEADVAERWGYVNRALRRRSCGPSSSGWPRASPRFPRRRSRWRRRRWTGRIGPSSTDSSSKPTASTGRSRIRRRRSGCASSWPPAGRRSRSRRAGCSRIAAASMIGVAAA
jgi:hypothetical protein